MRSVRLLAAACAVALAGGGVALARHGGTTALVAAPAAPVNAGAQPGDARSAGSATAPATPSPTATVTPTPTEAPGSAPPTARPRPEPSVPPETLSPAPDPTYLTDPHPVFGKVPPGTIQTTYVPGQRTWDVSGNGMHVVATIPATIRTGSPMTWHVTASGPGACCAVSLLYGDGYASPGGCDAAPAVTLTHVYNRAGRHAFEIQVQHDHCSVALLAFTGWFDVEAGTTSAQGPEPAQVQFDASGIRPAGHEDDLHWVSLFAEAHDPDGYVSRFVVDYGDGSPLETFRWSGECTRTLDGWPAEQYSTLPDDPPPAHHYATGTYTLTITAYSTGCDGTGGVPTTASFVWDAS